MPYTYTGNAILNTLRQMVGNLDSQRDQLVDAIERDYPRPSAPDNPEPDTHRERREQIHRDLVPFFTEIAHAREALVDAHNLLRDVVAPIDLARESRR
jgi:hypothetical protein